MFVDTKQSSRLENWEARITEVTECRICKNPHLASVIDLGKQALAGVFNDGKQGNSLETLIPLEMMRCDVGRNPDACGFLQLRHTVPTDILYHDYGYRSGINTTMRRHLQDLVRDDVEGRLKLQDGDIVVDIGANDGTLLMAYKQAGLIRVAFEPSKIRPKDPNHTLEYIPSIFRSEDFRNYHPGSTAVAVTSIAMFYDLPDPIQFCREVADILSDDGFWVLEMSYLGTMLQTNTFDTICHEHLGYYSLRTLRYVIEQAGFEFHDLSFNKSNGGSVRCTMTKRGRIPVPSANRARIDKALQDEQADGYDSPERYAKFRREVESIKKDLLAIIAEAKEKGLTVYGYGASTKGNVLLQYYGIGPNDLVAIADRNPAKHGCLTLGTKIPICSEDEMREAKPDLLLILPWHFLEEFLERERPLRDSGTRFIVPFPKARIV